MISVILTGTGNVARHMFNAFQKSGQVEVKQVFNHRKKTLDYFSKKTKTTTSIKEVETADFYIVAVSDDITLQTCELLKNKPGIIAHTSGNQALPEFKNRGVFYPLQTFSKEKNVDFSEIPICVEANSNEAEQKLVQLGNVLSENVQVLNGEQRKKLHLAAVFACNFSNHVMALSEKICRENDIEFSLLRKLILETAEKAVVHSPRKMQTGPAIRRDKATLRSHEESLENKPELLEVYKLLSQSIKDYGNEL
jgi:predicted short-subunit dehydrogenase-like oxidoreductase (DUF2520 family)